VFEVSFVVNDNFLNIRNIVSYLHYFAFLLFNNIIFFGKWCFIVGSTKSSLTLVSVLLVIVMNKKY
jgi:hypothetical protein